MDHIDRKIIDILQNNARSPLKEIADHVFLSSPAVSARIARLESSGTISGYQAQVDAPKLGYMVKAFINLDMDPQRKPEFYPYIQNCPPCGGVQLRHRRLQYADRGAVRHNTGAGPVHQPSAAVRPHPHPDRLFYPGRAPRCAGGSTGGMITGIPRSAAGRSSPSASGRKAALSGRCSSMSARPRGPYSCS